ncbi:hypothetical protein B0H12DRAFT_1032213 [Mycena haematopus]|nr:hypothetical protein B0H12DRAFT_1032213 [Mycena haematopus]
MSPNSKISEPQLLVIGRGSFGEVQLLSQTSLAFKSVLDTSADVGPYADAALEKEWNTMVGIYASCNSTSFFAIPRPLGLFLPTTSASGVHLAAPSDVILRGRQGKRYPSPNLIRLYFGRDGPERSQSRFINTKNFPMNVTQYNRLHRAMDQDGVAEPHEVARGMGEMLGKLHWKYGCDARDVEFVLGEGDGGVAEYWLLDFNQQTRQFDVEVGNIDELTQAHFSNDPYFPFARASNSLFLEFRRGYEEILSVHMPHIRARGQEFLQKLLAIQTERDQRARTYKMAGFDLRQIR